MNHALIDAVRQGRHRQVSLLVKAGVEVDETNDQGDTPLITCCTHVSDPRLRSKFLHLLLGAKADPNVQNKLGMSALMHASALGQVETTQILLNHVSNEM